MLIYYIIHTYVCGRFFQRKLLLVFIFPPQFSLFHRCDKTWCSQREKHTFLPQLKSYKFLRVCMMCYIRCTIFHAVTRVLTDIFYKISYTLFSIQPHSKKKQRVKWYGKCIQFFIHVNFMKRDASLICKLDRLICKIDSDNLCCKANSLNRF